MQFANLEKEKETLEKQLAEEYKALEAAIAEKERCEKAVEQTKIELLELEKEIRDKKQKEEQ